MTRRYFWLLQLFSAALGLSGCAVYVPMQCAAPNVRDRHEADVAVSNYLNSRWELGASYSPVRHVLVRAAGGLGNNSPQDRDTSYQRSRQYELAAGTYWPLGRGWLLGGLGGFGQARSEAAYRQGVLFSASRAYAFDARYDKIFGEAYGLYQPPGSNVNFGLAYRLTQVRFRSLTDAGVPVVEVSDMLRGEPMLFIRAGPIDGPLRAFQLALSWGSSTAFGYRQRDESSLTQRYQILQGRSYLTLGLVVRPHLFANKATK